MTARSKLASGQGGLLERDAEEVEAPFGAADERAEVHAGEDRATVPPEFLEERAVAATDVEDLPPRTQVAEVGTHAAPQIEAVER